MGIALPPRAREAAAGEAEARVLLPACGRARSVTHVLPMGDFGATIIVIVLRLPVQVGVGAAARVLLLNIGIAILNLLVPKYPVSGAEVIVRHLAARARVAAAGAIPVPRPRRGIVPRPLPVCVWGENCVTVTTCATPPDTIAPAAGAEGHAALRNCGIAPRRPRAMQLVVSGVGPIVKHPEAPARAVGEVARARLLIRDIVRVNPPARA